MKVVKTIGDVALVFLAIVSCIIVVAYIFYNIFNDKTTIGTNNISDQLALDITPADELTEEERSEYEERWFMEANYYSNDKNNGIELKELNFNYFTSHRLLKSDYRATGMQYVGEYSPMIMHNADDEYVNPDFYYYETTNGISFQGYNGNNINSAVGTLLNRQAKLTIKIDNKPYAIQLDGTYEYETRRPKWWSFGIPVKETVTVYYNYANLFSAVMQAVDTNSAGYGDYYITLDLSQYFSIYEYAEDGTYTGDNVTDIIKNYSVLKFHYDENGAIRSNQSIFGKIECNSKYDYEGVNFWDGRMVYILTEKDLKLRYSESYGGYLSSISNETKVIFDEMPAVKLLVEIDLSSSYLTNNSYNIVGLDHNAFTGFNIDTLTIKSDVNCEFNIMSDSFSGATLKTLKRTENITLAGELGIDYSEVIL